ERRIRSAAIGQRTHGGLDPAEQRVGGLAFLVGHIQQLCNAIAFARKLIEKKDEPLRGRLNRRRISRRRIPSTLGGVVRRTIPYGRFALIEPRGAIFGHVVLAPEYVLMQRAAHTSIRDVSYLAVWSETRSRAIARELAALAADGTGVVAAAMPEVLAILRAIAPVSTPLFL